MSAVEFYEGLPLPMLRELARSLDEEVRLLRRGLQQIAEGDYPADALNGETWANEILERLNSVLWQEDAL